MAITDEIGRQVGSQLNQPNVGVPPALMPKPVLPQPAVQAQNINVGQAPMADYDYAAARAAGINPDPKTGHWPDTYKLPSHITFSTESKYNDGGAGTWEQKGDQWYFTPGPTNLKYHTIEEIRDYFKNYETPDTHLVEPAALKR